MKSKRGISYDLRESDYVYSINNFKFVFSSLFYLNSYKSNLEEEVKYEKEKYKTKLKQDIDLTELILINRYKNIEKRGFLVYYKDKELKDYKFNINLEMR